MQIGARIGVYEVIAKLGEGGMGEVYRAADHSATPITMILNWAAGRTP